MKKFIFLHVILFMFSCSSVLSKFASRQDFMSLKFILLYGSVLFILFLYALLWQQVIKKMNITVAYANKAITVIWGMIWGMILFEEQITLNKIAGALIIIVGVICMVGEESAK